MRLGSPGGQILSFPCVGWWSQGLLLPLVVRTRNALSILAGTAEECGTITTVVPSRMIISDCTGTQRSRVRHQGFMLCRVDRGKTALPE